MLAGGSARPAAADPTFPHPLEALVSDTSPQDHATSAIAPESPLPPRRKRSAATSSSAFWRPLEAAETALGRLAQAVLPSGWALLLAAVLMAWRLLASFARGDLATGPLDHLLLGLAYDVALAHGLILTVRLISLMAGPAVLPNAPATRRTTFVLAWLWLGITLLRIATLVYGALEKRAVDAEFWAPLLSAPQAQLGNGALWAALAAAVATAGLARYCMTCDIEIAQALDIAEPRGKLLALTALAWLAAVGIGGLVAAGAAKLPPGSTAQVPEWQAGVALHQAWTAEAKLKKED